MNVYKHYKGGIYLTLNEDAIHTETNERMVVYCDMKMLNSPVYIRPYDMFHGYLEDGETKRFVVTDTFLDEIFSDGNLEFKSNYNRVSQEIEKQKEDMKNWKPKLLRR